MSTVRELVQRLRDLEAELERELRSKREEWQYRHENRKVRFEQHVRVAHRRLRKSLLHLLRDSSLRNILSAPIIYSVLLPVALLDLWATIYQWTCFTAYGIPKVKRAEFIVIDRHHLGYLNLLEKINCVYCGYANGVIAYLREIAGRTEQYWCPIKHSHRVRGPHLQYAEFVDYGDAEGYRGGLEILRRGVTRSDPPEDD